jgi:hypothetical protein
VVLWRDHPAGPLLTALVLTKKATLGLAILSMIAFQLAAATGHWTLDRRIRAMDG